MKLTEFDNKKLKNATRALNENYNINFDVERMSMQNTRTMLQKVRGLIHESRKSKNFYESQSNPAYMKLVFMEQSLAYHFNDLRSRTQTRIVTENEEIDQAQVKLAAQDMVDSVQKMIEEVSDMLVKELPALSSGVQSEIGVNEGEQYTSQATEALTSLQAALSQSKAGLESALNAITGQAGAPAEFSAGEEEMDMGMADMGAGEEEMDMGAEEMPAPSMEEPESAPTGAVGRVKR